jgi:hypothetical protein
VRGQVAAELYEPSPADGEERELIVTCPYSGFGAADDDAS